MAYNKKLYKSDDSVIDSSVIYDDTQAKLQSEINAEVGSDISDLNGSLNTYVRPNLLDNWYFIRGAVRSDGASFPINQRGQNSYAGAIYGIDRWVGATSNVSLGLNYNNYIVLKSSVDGGQNLLMQYFENKEMFAGKTVTISALIRSTLVQSTISIPADSSTWGSTIGTGSDPTSSGCAIYLRYLNSKLCFVFYATNSYVANTNILIKAAKIEIGDTQTLAHNENGVWVLNELPDYAEQFAKCQMYYKRFGGSRNGYSCFYGIAYSTSQIRTLIDLPLGMVKTPTVTVSDISNLRLVGGGSAIVPTAIHVGDIFLNSTAIPVYIDASGLTQYQIYAVVVMSNAYVAFSAE